MPTTLERMLELDGTDNEPRYTVDGYSGVAFYFHSAELGYREREIEVWEQGYGIGYPYYVYDMEEYPTDNALMVMVGDDRQYSIDPTDCTELDANEYCSECGQIGCTAYSNGEW